MQCRSINGKNHPHSQPNLPQPFDSRKNIVYKASKIPLIQERILDFRHQSLVKSIEYQDCKNPKI